MRTPLLPAPRIAALSVLAALASVACSPASVSPPDAGPASEAGVSSGDGGGDIVQACKSYAYARCTRLQSCSPTQILLSFETVQVCESYFQSNCVLQAEAPSSGSTVARIMACTADVPQWQCSDIIYAENVPPSCGAAMGALALGAPCASSSQCQTAWCARAPGSACGTCGPQPKAGDPCRSNEQCGSGLTCIVATGTCATRAKLGAQCSGAQPCDDGLTCTGGVCASGVSTAGAACSPLGAGCNLYAGLACNASTGTCDTLQVGPAGAPCGEVANQPQACVAGACVRGLCTPNPRLGQPCDTTGPTCLSVGICVADVDGGTTGTCRMAGDAVCN